MGETMLLNVLLAAGIACADLPSSDIDVRDLSRAQLEQIDSAKSTCWQANVHLGRINMVDGEFDKGIEYFSAAVEQAPENSMTHTFLGRAYLSRAGRDSSLGDAGDGVDHLETAISLDPENLDARETLAGFHRAAPWIAGGDMDEADEQGRYIRERDLQRGVMVLAANRMADGDEDEAIELLRETLDADPELKELAVQLGIAYHMQEDFDAAFEVLNKYAAPADADPMAIYQLGRTAALSGKFLDEGRAAMRRYIAMAEVDDTLGVAPSPAWWRLGMIEQHAGNADAARAAYTKALELDPDNKQAQAALKKLK